MKVISFRLKIEGSDIVENWVFDKKIPAESEELNNTMEEFYKKNIFPYREDNPLIAALAVATDSIPHEYAFFGDLVEVRFNDALRQVSVEE